MQVLIGFDLPNEVFFAVTGIGYQGNPTDTMPYFFKQTNGQYLLSEYEVTETNVMNVGVFLNTNSVSNLLP